MRVYSKKTRPRDSGYWACERDQRETCSTSSNGDNVGLHLPAHRQLPPVSSRHPPYSAHPDADFSSPAPSTLRRRASRWRPCCPALASLRRRASPDGAPALASPSVPPSGTECGMKGAQLVGIASVPCMRREQRKRGFFFMAMKLAE